MPLTSSDYAAVRSAQRVFERNRAIIESAQVMMRAVAEQQAEIRRMHSLAANAMVEAMKAVQRQRAEQAQLMAQTVSSGAVALIREAREAYTLLHELSHHQLQTYMDEVEVEVEGDAKERALGRLAVHRRYRRPLGLYQSPCRVRRNEGTHIPTYAVFWDEARLHLNPDETLCRRSCESQTSPASGAV